MTIETALAYGDTRMQAHRQIQPVKAKYQRIVLDLIAKHGTATCDFVECVTGLSHQLVSPRFTELHALGHIEDSGSRGRTRSGRTAILWRVRK